VGYCEYWREAGYFDVLSLPRRIDPELQRRVLLAQQRLIAASHRIASHGAMASDSTR
jgi:hypothetical protein